MPSSKKDRPKLDIQKEPIDIKIEVVGFIGLLVLIGLPLYFYAALPETIPKHYGPSGEPDAYGSKNYIWTLPVLGTLMYLGLSWLNKYPHTFNYAQKVTAENARRLYTTGARLTRTLNTLVTCGFAFITYATIQIALGHQAGLGSSFTPLFMITIFGTTGYFLVKSFGK